MADFDERRACAWYDRAKTNRSSFETTWNQLRRVFFPQAQDFTAQNDTQGKRDRNTAVDGHGVLVANQFADYIVAAVANPASKWLSVGLADGSLEPSPAERVALEKARDAILSDLHDPRSNFSDALRAAAKEFGAFGNGAMYTGDRPGILPLFLQVPLAEAAWEWDADDELARFGWKKRWTALQAAEKFGLDRVGAKVKEAAESANGEDAPFDFLHVMDRNPDFVTGSDRPAERRWRVRWIEVATFHKVSESFLDDSCYAPFTAPRTGQDAYGRGCGDNALEDTNMAQRVRVVTVRGMEKQIDPPTVVPDDGVVSLPTNEARGLLVVRSELMRNGNVPVASLRPEGRPELGLEISKVLHQAIDQHWYVEYTRLPREPRMPIAQIVGLQEEQMRALGPLLTAFQRGVALIVARVWSIRRLSNRMPDMPAEMAGKPLAL